MTDLNSWNINYLRWLDAYPIDYDFGLKADDSPFTVQAAVSDADSVYNDEQHGTDDGVLMGRDLLGGKDITFTLTTLPTDDAVKWTAAMNKVSEFEGVWRAQGLRERPGRYATLKNYDRARFTYGRPRNFAPKYDRARRGRVEYVAQFRTATPYWYSVNQSSLVVPRNVNTDQAFGGDAAIYPIITFTGPFTTATLQWVPGLFLTGWSITLNHALVSGDFVKIDTRPLFRGATDPGANPRNGWLTGTPMSNCRLFPTDTSIAPAGHFLFTTTGTTGGATKCQVDWYTTYSGL